MKINVSFEKLNLLNVKVKLANKSSLIEIELDLANPTKISFLISCSDFSLLIGDVVNDIGEPDSIDTQTRLFKFL